jgi:hypothetical protein
MYLTLSFKNRVYFTFLITLSISCLLVWDHFHGGVPVHHLLQRKELPSFSNWWGGILVPTLSWFLLYRIQKRISLKATSNKSFQLPTSVILAFIGSLLIGIFISVLFSFGLEDILGYVMLVIVSMGLFLPTYHSEYLLGFVVGMAYTFGGVLPALVGLVLVLVGFIANSVSRLIQFLYQRIVS